MLDASRATENGLLVNLLNISPRLSSHTNPRFHLETSVSKLAPLCWDPEKAVGCNSIISIPSSGTPTPKSSSELREEIAILESEILHLERRLLSLYRRSFEEHLSTLSNTAQLKLNSSPSPRVLAKPLYCKVEPHVPRGDFVSQDQTSTTFDCGISDLGSSPASLKETSPRDSKKSDSGHHSLADLFGASHIDNNHDTPDRLSENIVRCISSIYCKISKDNVKKAGVSASPISSLSSSSIFSSKNPCDSWSPRRKETAGVHHLIRGSKEEIGFDSAVVEVLKISLDDERLEKVDPSKMKREEKLAFWINIHNALLMHAYLAYGVRDGVKSTSFLKAAYNVGGHCITACIIQSSILGIRSHHSTPWLQSLFSPARKPKPGNVKHIYSLEYPEPLVHFALCSGTYSDPMVRVYKAKDIFKDLKISKEEFIKANVYIEDDKKIFLPKVLQYFAKEMSLDLPGLSQVISQCLSKAQQKVIQFVLLINRQGKIRLTKWYSPYSQKDRAKVVRELSGIVLTRGPRLCNFVEWGTYKVAYRRYAGLYFCMCIDQDDNELEALDIIHHYVETLDRYFGSVCELDLIFNFHKAYYILDEVVIAGELQESSKKTIIRLIDAQDAFVELAKEQASMIGNIIAQANK
ncbi:hypothetical protein ACFE04_025754 [Oxalis oulophora]